MTGKIISYLFILLLVSGNLVAKTISSMSEAEDNLIWNCPTPPVGDTVFLRCTPQIPEIFKDLVSNGDEDRIYFENIIGGDIVSSCNNVVIRVVDVNQAPFATDCNDFLVFHREYRIYDGVPNDPTVSPEICRIIYKVEIPFPLTRVGGFPDDLEISCEDDITVVFNDFLANWGYQDYESCTPVSLMSTIPDPVSEDDLFLSCNKNIALASGKYLRVQFNLVDECGFELVTAANFFIIDETPPEITCPDNILLNVADDRLFDKIDSLIMEASAADNCSMPVIEDDFEVAKVDIYDCNPTQIIDIGFRALDECQNQSICNTQVTINNFGEPSIDCPPMPLEIECGHEFNIDTVRTWLAMTRAKDKLGDIISSTNVTNSFTESDLDRIICNETLNIIFEAEDNCGQTANCQSTITIIDTNEPVIINCPNDTTILASSGDTEIISGITTWENLFSATDQCNTLLELTSDLEINDLLIACGNNREVEVTFIADDICENSDSTICKRTITIQSDIVATIEVPIDTIIECAKPIDQVVINNWASQAAGYNNAGDVFVIQNDLDFTLDNLSTCGDTPVRFFFIDQCADTIDAFSQITIVDNIAPEITCPLPLTLDGEIDIIEPDIVAWIGSAIVTDNCGAEQPVTDYSRFLFADCPEEITREITFRVEDICNGLVGTCKTELTIKTIKQPTIQCPDQLVLSCGDPMNLDSIQNWLTLAEGFDFGGTPLTAIQTFDPTGLELITCLSDTIISFTVIDASCGYSAECSASISINDTQAPNITTCPIELTINSTNVDNQMIINNWLETVRYDDNNCFDPSLFINLDPDTLDFCNQASNLVVKFSVSDQCGLEASCDGRITFNSAPPNIICPSTLPLNCGNSNNESLINDWLTTVIGSDNNGVNLFPTNNLDLTVIDSVCTQTLSITFEIEDNCAQANSCTAEIIINDTTAPTISCPGNESFASGDPDKKDKFLIWIENIIIDDCTPTTLNYNFDPDQFTVDCTDEIIPITITAQDECGNVSTPCMTNLEITNSIFVTIDNSWTSSDGNLSLECGAPENTQLIEDWRKSISALDNQGTTFDIVDDFSFNNPSLISCGGQIEVLFTFTDFCSASIDTVFYINVVDTQAPIAICPSDTTFILESPTFDADVNIWLNQFSGTDNCFNQLGYSNNYLPVSSLEPCEPSEDIIITFEAKDDCNLSDQCTSILTVRTLQSPNITCPADITIECGSPANNMEILNWLNSAVSIDGDGNPLPYTDEFNQSQIDDIDCNGIVEVAFNLFDAVCQISDDCTANIFVEDTTPPTPICPEDLTVNSLDPSAITDIQAWSDSYTSLDNCSTPIESIGGGFIIPNTLCNQDELTEVLFISEDACGLTANCTASININKSGPEITCPTDIILECGDPNSEMQITNWIETVSATDNSGATLVVDNDLIMSNLPDSCSSALPVFFITTDDCGKEANCMRFIRQEDTTSPSIQFCPPTKVFDIETPNLMSAVQDWLLDFQAEDLCNTAVLSNNYNLELDIFDCGSKQDVTFQAVDECGNTNTDCMANISFENNLVVEIACPETVIIKCDDFNTIPNVSQFLNSARGTSEDDFEITTDFQIEDIQEDCEIPYTQEIVFTITDRCNNTNNCTSYIEFIPSASIYIPNIFSATESGNNATFQVGTNIAIENINSMRIYSRWGDLMHEELDFDPNEPHGWNGQNSRGQYIQGVYTYHISFIDIFGNPFEFVGTLTLIQ